MPWPSEWDDDGRPDRHPPRQALDLPRLAVVADRTPRWDVDDVGDDYEEDPWTTDR